MTDYALTAVCDLRLWTILDPNVAAEDGPDRILTSLEALKLPNELEHLRDLALDRRCARQEAANAALMIARTCPRSKAHPDEHEDVVASFLWVASWLGSSTASLLLVDALFDETTRLEFSTGIDVIVDGLPLKEKVRENARLWFQNGVAYRLNRRDPDAFAELLRNELAWQPRANGPSRVVIRNWCLDDSGTDLAKYRALAGPVPLRGGDRDPDLIVRTLSTEFPWMRGAVDHVAADIALCRLNPEPWIRIRPLLLVGAPGTGKTHFARRLAELIGTGSRVIAAGGSSDNRDIEGSARGWSDHEPSSVLRLMLASRSANPVIIVDEIDKAGGSTRNGDIRHTLLSMIEPETSRAWPDDCLQSPCDLSAVTWVFTANDVTAIARPLLSRMSVVRVGLPGRTAIEPILAGMRLDIAGEMGLDPARLPELHPVARRALADALAKGHSLRRIKSALVRALAASTRRDEPKS